MNADITSNLERWLNDHRVACGRIRSLEKLTGGTQNLLFRFAIGDDILVLRRPGLHARPEAEQTIRREARVLASLDDTAVPHPRYRGHCTDTNVIGAPFVITDAVEGFNATVGLGEAAMADPAIRHRMGLAMIEGIAAISEISPEAVGLEGFGKLDGFISRQVPRWQSQLDGYSKYAEWPGPQGLDGIAILGVWLEGHQPSDWQPGLMHGDYHLANVLFQQTGELAAILDWELSTLGDPLLDLGRLLASWPDPDGSGPLSLKVEPWDCFPVREELVGHYRDCTSRVLADLPWYEVLACYKLAIILEGTFARACAGLADPETGRRLHESAVALIERARQVLERDA
jgi:aminoglycoside phosphotransferase (APT) family kinase protein